MITHGKLHPVLMFENLLPWSYSPAQRMVLLHMVLQEKSMIKMKPEKTLINKEIQAVFSKSNTEWNTMYFYVGLCPPNTAFYFFAF